MFTFNLRKDKAVQHQIKMINRLQITETAIQYNTEIQNIKYMTKE